MAADVPVAFGDSIDGFSVGDGAVGPISLGGREVVRRIFVTVRDARWQEVPPSDWRVERLRAGSIQIEARHVGPDVDFSWQGSFVLDPVAMSFAFTFDGEAHRDMEVCRLGLVLLCPVPLAAGAKLVLGAPGRAQILQLPQKLGAQVIRDGLPSGLTEPFDTLTIEAADGRRVAMRFSGELFEIEDQRNWGDASFKVYCTPLRLGFPRPVAKGAHISHRVETQVRMPPRRDAGILRSALLADADPSPLPRVVVSADRMLAAPAPWPVAAVELDRPGAVDDLRRLRAIAPDTRIDLGLAALDLTQERAGVLPLLGDLGSRLDRVRLSGAGAELPTPADLVRLRELLARSELSATPIFAATRGYFVEFNRGVPFDLEVDGIAFPVSPTVHGDHVRTAFENGAVVADMVQAGRRLTGCERVAIAPLDWRFPAVSARSPAPLREVGLWALSALINAAHAKADSICLGPEALGGLEALANRPVSALLGAVDGARLLPLRLFDEFVSLAALVWPDGRTLLVATNLSDIEAHLALPPPLRPSGRVHLLVPPRDFVATETAWLADVAGTTRGR